MTLRTRFLITALLVCHYLPAEGLVTRQLLFDSEDAGKSQTQPSPQVASSIPVNSPCGGRAATQLQDGTLICADQQEKIGNIFKLRGNAEIHYRTYVLKA